MAAALRRNSSSETHRGCLRRRRRKCHPRRRRSLRLCTYSHKRSRVASAVVAVVAWVVAAAARLAVGSSEVEARAEVAAARSEARHNPVPREASTRKAVDAKDSVRAQRIKNSRACASQLHRSRCQARSRCTRNPCRRRRTRRPRRIAAHPRKCSRTRSREAVCVRASEPKMPAWRCQALQALVLQAASPNPLLNCPLDGLGKLQVCRR